MATLRPRAARRTRRAQGQRDRQTVRRKQGRCNHLRRREVARQLQVQPAALQADVYLAAQKRRDGGANHRRGCNGREERHELL